MKNKVILIGEAGVNHNGDINIAKKLIDVAASSGLDYVKFQTFKVKNLVTRLARKADYQLNNSNDKENFQFELLKKLEMPIEWHYELKDYAQKSRIKFLSTGFDEESIDFLESLGVDFFKISSGDITNKPLLKHVAKKRKKVIISTGMSDMYEVYNAFETLINAGLKKEMITVLHCNTEYPTPFKDVNLLAMKKIKDELDVQVGYSDHTLGIEIPIASVSLGAKVIEKHFTLDKSMEGPDHSASLEPSELKQMVKTIRNIELAINGSGIKEPSESEKKNIYSIRKSLHFRKDLPPGHLIQEEDLIALRPGSGVSPMLIENFVGKRLSKNVNAFSMIKEDQFQQI